MLAVVAALLQGTALAAASAAAPGVAAGPPIRLASNHMLDGLSLVFRRSAEQQQALQQLLAAQQDASSPSYHHWLTPEQFAAQFGATEQQIQAASGWLSRQGFVVGDVARGGGWISFKGTAAQVERAFATRLRGYSASGRSMVVAATEPTLPGELSSAVAGLRGLSQLPLQPQIHALSTSGQVALDSILQTGWRPADFAARYDVAPLYASGVNGSGTSIAVAGQAEIDPSDVAELRAALGLPVTQLKMVRAVSSSADGVGQVAAATSADVAEAETALLWAGAVAPNAGLVYVNVAEGGNALDAAAYAIDQDLAPVLSVSYGGCEQSFSSAEIAAYRDVFAQADAEGITVVAAAGDAGAAACDTGATTATAQGLAARFPASLPYVTAVGGSQIAGSASATGTGDAAESAWSSAGQLSAGGGGVSALFDKPTWQQGSGVPADGKRDLPDVALLSSAAGSAPAGTSVSAPEFAGVVALLVQQAGGPLGNINPRLYALAASQPQVFNDIAVGSNTVACAAGARGCGADGLLGFQAAAGYDQATGLGSVDVAALAKAFPEATVATTTTLTAATTNFTHGVADIFTATISPSSGPTGTVTFSGAGVTLGTATVSGGVATLTSNQLPGGSDTVTASYSGDGTYVASQGTLQVTVLPESANISGAISSTNIAPGGSATVTVTVSSFTGVGTPTGTASATIEGGGATFTSALSPTSTAGTSKANIPVTAPTTAGSYTMQLNCSGDNSFTCGSSLPTVAFTVGEPATTTVLTLSPNSPVAGSPVSLTATVSAVKPTGLTFPTGTVQFLDNGAVLGAASIVATSGSTSASLTTTLSPGTTHSLTAVYSGDSNWGGSTSPAVTVAGGKAGTTTTLAASSFTVAYGANLTLTATAASSATGLTTSPTGTMTFSAATQGLLGAAALAAGTGTASFSSSKLPPGLYTLTAAYSGDATYAPSTSTQNIQVTVGAATATVTASASPSSGVMYGTTSTITATVQGSGATTPTGTITVTVPGIPGTYTGTLVANSGPGGSGTVNVTIPAPPPGTYAVQVAYGGDTIYPSSSTTTALTTIKGNTVTTLNVSPNPAVLNTPTTLTATVAPVSALAGTAYSLAGTVQFYDGATALGSPVAVVNNQAVGTETFKTLGTHNITAVYSGDTDWNSSTSGIFAVAVTAVPTTTVLNTNFPNNTALAGANIVFTVVVSPQSSATITGINAVPTGTVTFYDTFNGSFTTLGSAMLQQNGLNSSAATFQTKLFLGGTHVITAVYGGDRNFLTSTAGTTDMTIQDFTMAAVPPSGTVSKGSAVQVPIVVTPVGGFTGTVAFGCNAPGNTETSCMVTPAQIIGGGGTVTVVLSTTAAHVQTAERRDGGQRRSGFLLAGAGASLAGLILLMAPMTGGRRRLPSLWVIALALCLLGAGTGCSTSPTTTAGKSGAGTGPADPGSPQGTISFVISAVGTDGLTSVSHQMTYQLTVQ